MNRKDEYNKNVKGKIGALDIVGVKNTVDFVVNKAGAKIYKDITRHTELEIPKLANEEEHGAIYEVLSVGMMPPGLPIVTVKIGDLPVAFKLPQELASWVQSSIGMVMQGVKKFPTEVEFGKLKERCYAKIL